MSDGRSPFARPHYGRRRRPGRVVFSMPPGGPVADFTNAPLSPASIPPPFVGAIA